MKPAVVRLPMLLGGLFAAFAAAFLHGKEPPAAAPATGPQTEKRFPALKLPPGFQATLYACDPLVEYPSAIARGPRPGTLFMAADYMTGLGMEIVRRDEIRLLSDTDADGYAERAPVFADGFNSIQGMTSHGDTLYVMHSPKLTALRDADGDGKPEERRDLLVGLGLPPEENPVRLHCANGITMGHDGWLYLALGDRGANVLRPEGDRLIVEGGGILRCRPDGSDLHLFAGGLRNIYDVALDDQLNVFVRDNENDGGNYKLRMCRSFFGADHGYPYLYEERPNEALAPLTDLGLGSSAGGVCYRERQFPSEFQGNLFWCEWGRAVMRYPLHGSGSSFTREAEIEFAAGADDDPYPFKPTDLVVDHDGSLLVSDWCDGQRPNRGRARIYRIQYVGPAPQTPSNAYKQLISGSPILTEQPVPGALPEWMRDLDSPSYDRRWKTQEAIQRRGAEVAAELIEAVHTRRLGPLGRMHAVWCLTHLQGPAAIEELLKIADRDPSPKARIQAVRALADLTDPALQRHRLDAGPGDAAFAERLADLNGGADARVLLEIVVALGRLRWEGAVEWMKARLPSDVLPNVDTALSHAAQQTMRRSGNWPAVVKLLDLPDDAPLRTLALRALAERFEPAVVAGLIDRLAKDKSAARRGGYADLLARVYKRPGPWAYWTFRPPPRPANNVAWEQSDAIAAALDKVLADPDEDVRRPVLLRMQREKVATKSETLGRLLALERRDIAVAVILEALAAHDAAAISSLAAVVVRDRSYVVENRLRALELLLDKLDAAGESRLVELAAALENGPVLAALLRAVQKLPQLPIDELLTDKLGRSTDPETAAAALDALVARKAAHLDIIVLQMLVRPDRSEAPVRRAAASAAGTLQISLAVNDLLILTGDADPSVRRASLESLRLLKEPRVVPLAVKALADRETALAALACIRELSGPAEAVAIVEIAKRSAEAELMQAVVRTLDAWCARDESTAGECSELQRAAAGIQGSGGVLVRWNVRGPSPADLGTSIVEQWGPAAASPAAKDVADWQLQYGAGPDSRVKLTTDKAAAAGEVWSAFADVSVPVETPVEFQASSAGTLRVWLNGKQIFKRDQVSVLRPDADRFPAVLAAGPNRVLMQIAPPKEGAAEFHLRFRRKSSKAEHERLVQAALNRTGNADRGRELFFAAEKSLCVKCHRLDDKGERIGPELTGVGGRFSRIYIIESILEPSRTIAPSFETITLVLNDGRTLTGVKTAETDTTMTLADNEGRKHEITKREIDERETRPTSTMADGLEKRFTVEQFVDLITFLTSRREAAKPRGTITTTGPTVP